MANSYVKNPESGKKIRVGGPTYKSLEAKGYNVARLRKVKAPAKKKRPEGVKGSKKGVYRGTVSLPKAAKIPLSRTLAKVPKSRKAKRSKLATQVRRSTEGRGSKTRGWAASAPQKGKERQALYAKCGSSCFLRPERLGFPICPSLREGAGCKVDCRGVTSARVRAAQYKYPDVERRAIDLQKRYRC